jgi:hypothetical protein
MPPACWFSRLAETNFHFGLHSECINLLRLLEQAGPAGLAGDINFA